MSVKLLILTALILTVSIADARFNGRSGSNNNNNRQNVFIIF